MSTTNNDEQKIIMQQIDSSDTIIQFMEKCNNNFYTISKNGGGPIGKEGIQGSQGVPTKPKVPIHVWKKGEQYENESFDETSKKFKLNLLKEDELGSQIYQVGHLIVLENAHVYKLVIDENNDENKNKLTPEYIFTLQSYDPGSVVDGKSAYVHIAFANFDEDGTINDFILSKDLNFENDSNDRKYMGIYSDDKEEPSTNHKMYTWIKVIGNNSGKGEKGDTPIQKSVKAIGYSLTDLELDNEEEWKESISELEILEPCTNIYIKNEYIWSDGNSDESKTYGKTVTMSGTQGVKGDTGRVLFYLGSFKDGTLTGDNVIGYLNEYRCDYYIDVTGQAWMRIGTSENATGNKDGSNDDNWTQSEKIGFLKDGAISADMINNSSFSKKTFDAVNANEINADNINADNIKSEKISSIDGNSWLNLKKSEFSFNNGELSYINGKLHIGGLPNIGGQNLLENTSFHYNYIAGEKVAFTILYTLDAGQKYIATYGKFEDNAGVDNEWARGVCLVVSQSPSTESIEQVVEFGKPFEVNGNGRYLYIAWGAYGYVDFVKGSTSNEDTSNNFIQYLDQVMLQEGEIATEFQEPIAKYDYLTRVLKDGSTDIEGGLVMTNVLGLKDIQINPDDTTTEQVIAGMSGVKDDNVLLWGGGTYEEAVYAASTDNDFYVGENKSGRQITSLLKKDGQGKIGIFKISDTQAVVKTEQGEILIDATDGNGGIYVKDNNGENNVIIKNDDISLNDIFSNDNLKENITGEKTLTKQQYVSPDSPGTVYYGLNLANIKALDGGVLKIKNIRVELNDPTITPTANYTPPFSYNITTKLTIGNDTASSTYNYTSSYHLKDINGAIIDTVEAESTGSMVVQLNSDSIKEYALDSDINIGVTVSVSKKECTCIPSTIKASVDVCYVQKSRPCTVIGSNGICSFVDRNTLFGILNENNMQKAYLIGLPDSETAETGQLYKTSDGTIKVK